MIPSQRLIFVFKRTSLIRRRSIRFVTVITGSEVLQGAILLIWSRKKQIERYSRRPRPHSTCWRTSTKCVVSREQPITIRFANQPKVHFYHSECPRCQWSSGQSEKPALCQPKKTWPVDMSYLFVTFSRKRIHQDQREEGRYHVLFWRISRFCAGKIVASYSYYSIFSCREC